MTAFRHPIKYNAANGQTRVPNASRGAGIPVGIIEQADWFVKNFEFTNETHLPLTTPGTGDSDAWTVTVTGTTPVATLSDDLFPPHLIITNSATDDDSWEGQYTDAAGAGEFFNLASGKLRYFKCGFALGDADQDAASVLQADVFLGFAITDTTVIDGATDFIGFHKADGSGLVNFVAGKNAGTSGALVDQIVQSTGITLGAADAGNAASSLGVPHYFEFLAIGTSVVLVYADGVHVATVSSTTQLPDDEQLCPTICVQNGEGQAKVLKVTKFFVAMEL